MPIADKPWPERVAEGLKGWGGVAVASVVLTLVMAAPVLMAPTTLLFGTEIVGRHADPFIVIHQLENPQPLGLFTQPATDYPGALIARLTGDAVSAYNIVVLATFPLAAVLAFLFALRLTGSRPVAWVAGLAYAFSPFHIAQSAYHPHGAQIQWLPLFLLALWLSLERATPLRSLLLLVSIGLVALSNFYYGLMIIVLTPFAVFGFWAVQRSRPTARPAGLWMTGLLLAGLGVAGLGYAALYAPAVFDSRTRPTFPPRDLALYGAAPSSYLSPPVEHPILGPRVRDSWRRVKDPSGLLEQQITHGYGVTLLALLALGLYLSGNRDPELEAAPALALIASAAFAVSLAPADPVSSGAIGSLLRPSGLIHEALPMFRAYARFSLAVFLPATILAAAAARVMLRGESRVLRSLAVGLLAIALFELAPFPPFRARDILPTTAHRFLASQAAPIRVLDCIPPGRSGERTAFLRFRHQVSVPGPWSDCGDPDFPAKLAHEGFTHVIVRGGSPIAGWLRAAGTPASLVRSQTFDDSALFKLQAKTASKPFLEFSGGFHWREFVGDRTYRWMRQAGSLVIVRPSGWPQQARLQLELHAFPAARTVRVEIDGAPLVDLEIGTEPATYALPSIQLRAPRHSITLRSLAPAVVADSVLGNGDTREITIALWGWQLE